MDFFNILIVICDSETFWLFETKTNLGSVRPGQLDEQVACAKRILGDRRLFVTAGAPVHNVFNKPEGVDRAHFSDLTWVEISRLVGELTAFLPSGSEKEKLLKFIKAAAAPDKKAAGSKSMSELQTWKPGMSGIMYLPEPGSSPGQNARPYFMVEVSESLEITLIDGPFTWTSAREEAIELGMKMSKITFSTPEGKIYEQYLRDGLLTW